MVSSPPVLENRLTNGAPQFGTAEYAGSDCCKSCNQTVAGTYYRVNRVKVCSSCAQRLKGQLPKDSHQAYARGLLFGGGGAVLYQVPGSGGQTSTTLRFIDSDGNNISAAIVLTTTQPETNTPAAAMAGLQNGNVVVVHDANAVIHCRLYAPDGTEVGPEAQLSQGPLASFPDVAVLKDGSFVAVWQENNGGTLQIVYRRVYGIFADGVVATPPAPVPKSSGGLFSGGGLQPQIT